MKRFLAAILSLAMMITVFAGCGSTKTEPSSETPSNTSTVSTSTAGTSTVSETTVDPASFKGEFTWWTFFDKAPYLKEQFAKTYPNVKINLQVFGGDEYQTKLMTTIQSGKDIPDLMDLEESYVYKFIESDTFTDLGALGGNELVKDYYDWAVAMGKDSKGTLKGICDNVSPVAFWYVREQAEKWLGTSDDAKISEMLSSWDKIMEVSKKVKTDSKGKVFLWPNLSEVVKVEGYSITPFIRDGKFAINDEWYNVIKIMRNLWEQKLVADLGSWSGEWSAAWNSGSLLIRCMPSWDFFTSDENKGKVGVAKPPKNSYEGGTYRAIYEKSSNKEACMEFLKFLTTTEYQINDLKDNNQMPATKLVFGKMGADYKSDNFGGQNILKTYNDICENIPPIVPDQYTRDAQNIFTKHCEEGIKKGLTDEKIIENFKKELKDKYPEVQGF